jgi:CMP-N-acetylneuraminic acid synthetase
MNILITICARGGSKGIPRKNIKPICEKPLIQYTIDLSNKLKLKLNAKVALSTDDNEIKSVAHSLGLHTAYDRPDILATDSAGKIDTIKDLLFYEESLVNKRYDFILDLDVTSPLRTLEDVERSLDLMLQNPDAMTLFSVNNSSRNPYFNMVEENANGYYTLIKTNVVGSILSRQAAPDRKSVV